MMVNHSGVPTLTAPWLELPPGISPALVTLVPGTAAAKAIPAGDTIYPRLCETVSDNYVKSY